MANKNRISFSLAFLAAAIVLASGQATAVREVKAEANGSGAKPSELEMVLNELIEGTEHARSKVPVLGNSQMVHDCDKDYSMSLDSLKKAMSILKGQSTGDLQATVLEALKYYDNCDYSYAQSTRPSPFIPNNATLKLLGSKCLKMTSNQAKRN